MFRRWLIERLIATGFASREYSDRDCETVAVEMGIQPDVLVEARLDVLESRVKGKRHALTGPKRAGSMHYQYQLEFPEQLWPIWENEAARRGIKGSVLLRSLIHCYLCGSWEPEVVSKQWRWEGIGYSIPHQRRQRGTLYPWRERALVPLGAKRALTIRAERHRASARSVVRSLALATMSGIWARPGDLVIVDCTAMFDDENLYYLGAHT